MSYKQLFLFVTKKIIDFFGNAMINYFSILLRIIVQRKAHTKGVFALFLRKDAEKE